MKKADFLHMLVKNYTRMYALFHGIEKKIIFNSFNGKQYSDNPRSISEKMHEMYPEYKLVWILNTNDDPYKIIPDYIETVPAHSRQYLHHIATAFCYIQNEVMRSSRYKRKKQLFIQTWHGDRGLKQILYDALEAQGIQSNEYIDGKVTDIFIVGSDYAEKRIGSAFHYYGETLKVGMPRNDKLVYPADVDTVKARIGIKKDARILLYAPTMRRGEEILKCKVNLKETLKILTKGGDDWICLVRAHPKSVGVDVQDNIQMTDVSAYPDMADLLMIADLLITDYSSCAGDFILRHKPVILAQFDREWYNQHNRQFYVDVDKTGFLIAQNQEELNQILSTMSEKDYVDNCDKVMHYFGTKETGCSAEQICKMIDRCYREKFNR